MHYSSCRVISISVIAIITVLKKSRKFISLLIHPSDDFLSPLFYFQRIKQPSTFYHRDKTSFIHREEDALTSLELAGTKAFKRIFPTVVSMKYFSVQRGARPIKFARSRRAIIHEDRAQSEPFPHFSGPPFFGNVFKVPCAANRKRLCLARVTARRTPTSCFSRSIYHRDVYSVLAASSPFLRFRVVSSGSSYSPRSTSSTLQPPIP